MDIDHKYDRKILSQNEKLAKIRKEKRLDKRLEARVSKIEDTEMKMDIKVTSVSTHFWFPSVLHCLTQFLKKIENATGTTTNPIATAKYC